MKKDIKELIELRMFNSLRLNEACCAINPVEEELDLIGELDTIKAYYNDRGIRVELKNPFSIIIK